MPSWTLTTENGIKDTWDVVDYRKNKGNVVLSFAIRYKAQGQIRTEAFVLSPKHRHKEVPKVVQSGLELVSASGGAATGYTVGSAAGLVGGLTGGALGFFLGHLATHSAIEFFEEEVIDDGDYYDSRGYLAFRGLITVK
jgi:hypothetical protein